MSDKESKIIAILYKYEDYLSDGYGHYYYPKYISVTRMIGLMAKDILKVEYLPVQSLIRSIIRIFKLYEPYMSDGFSYYYYSNEYGPDTKPKFRSERSLLIHIAQEIIHDVFNIQNIPPFDETITPL